MLQKRMNKNVHRMLSWNSVTEKITINFAISLLFFTLLLTHQHSQLSTRLSLSSNRRFSIMLICITCRFQINNIGFLRFRISKRTTMNCDEFLANFVDCRKDSPLQYFELKPLREMTTLRFFKFSQQILNLLLQVGFYQSSLCQSMLLPENSIDFPTFRCQVKRWSKKTDSEMLKHCLFQHCLHFDTAPHQHFSERRILHFHFVRKFSPVKSRYQRFRGSSD